MCGCSVDMCSLIPPIVKVSNKTFIKNNSLCQEINIGRKPKKPLTRIFKHVINAGALSVESNQNALRFNGKLRTFASNINEVTRNVTFRLQKTTCMCVCVCVRAYVRTRIINKYTMLHLFIYRG